MNKINLVVFFISFTFVLNAEIISLKEAKHIALKNNLEFLTSKLENESTDYDYKKAILQLIPSASVNGNCSSDMKQDFPELNPSFGITVTQKIFIGGKTWLNYKIQKDKTSIAEVKLKDKRMEVINEVESKYFTVLENNELLRTAQINLKSSKVQLQIATSRFENGTISKIDILQLQSQKASKEANLILIENTCLLSRMDLANYLQISNDYQLEEIPLDLYENLINKLKTLNIAQIDKLTLEIIEIAKANNASLKIGKLAQSMSKKAISMAVGNFLPSLNLSYSKNWDKNEFLSTFEDSDRLSLSATIPIFPVADNTLELLKAKNDYKTSYYNYKSTEDGLFLGLKNSLYNLIALAKSVDATKKSLEFAQETYLQTEEKFKLNSIPTNDLLDAEIMLTSSKNQYTQSIYKLLREKSALVKLMGIEDGDVLTDLINK